MHKVPVSIGLLDEVRTEEEDFQRIQEFLYLFETRCYNGKLVGDKRNNYPLCGRTRNNIYKVGDLV